MSSTVTLSRYPLHIHIATLFTVLVLLLGTILAWVSYRQISELSLESAELLYTRTVDQLELQFAREYRPVATSLQVLASAAVTRASSLEERMQHLPVLAGIIRSEPQVAGFGIGYDDGDYFILRPLNTDHLRQVFDAPAEAAFIVDHISHRDDQPNQQLRLFLAEQLEPIGEAIFSKTDYDPRSRPWYTTADEEAGLQISSPYLFFFSRKVGITLSALSTRGNATVAADITLDNLATVLERNRITPSTISLLVNGDNQLLAYSDANAGDIAAPGNDSVPSVAQLPQSLRDSLQLLGEQAGKVIPVTHSGERWIGSLREIGAHNRLDLRLLTLTPERELLASAYAMRRTSVMIIAAVVLLILPIAWFFANQIARPLRALAREARSIADFDFESPVNRNSMVIEVHQLARDMDSMRETIHNFFGLITSLSGEPDFNRLLDRVTDETMLASGADAAVIYLLDEDEIALVPQPLRLKNGTTLASTLAAIETSTSGKEGNRLAHCFAEQRTEVVDLRADDPAWQHLAPVFETMQADVVSAVLLPLANRNDEGSGLLCLLYDEQNQESSRVRSSAHIGFTQALSGFAAVSMESRQLLKMQKDLLQSFIELIASAIDAKSPYTGGHCQRVPELAKMLARAACDSHDPRFADFSLDEAQWEELHIAAWLHDCGKVTTPEYVVDKATKLETIYDRIHEIRMRFEVLKRDAEIDYWRSLCEGADQAFLQGELERRLAQLDDDFDFVATCNQGGEFMAEDKIERLNAIARQTWTRTLSDRLGISQDEARRKQRDPEPELPVEEPLIADQPHHLFHRGSHEVIADDNPWNFKLETPRYKYNQGELYNLSIARGTLTAEERFKINEHMVQTIVMLDQLPFPRHLRDVPAIAGGHHETMIGTGYPKKLRREDLSLTARMMAIADIFEALTAADRPYKKAKTLSESIRIMSFMKKDQHIDADLFELFLQSGVYLTYAEEFLEPNQIDEVDISAYLNR